VQAHSPSADDLLPGLCALAQQWLGDVLLPSFVCCTHVTPSLDAWFQDGRVKLHLQASCLRAGSHLSCPVYPTTILLCVCLRAGCMSQCVLLDGCTCRFRTSSGDAILNHLHGC